MRLKPFRKSRFPMLANPTGAISRNFQVMIEAEGMALRGTFIINPEGQIKAMEVNDNGIGRAASSKLGIFAAGDCTSVPYKQIVVAMGERAKAALSAFDDLIRHDVQN